ncbi:hypothetical protein ACIQGZ_21900 [Streptomyces sp. NPDC092296]|uniref:hypothetical protein n=1 Tax=Streptomyces sp. NPDC092296 TaxID=3366012 RepID=UPI0037F33FA6
MTGRPNRTPWQDRSRATRRRLRVTAVEFLGADGRTPGVRETAPDLARGRPVCSPTTARAGGAGCGSGRASWTVRWADRAGAGGGV